MLKTHLARDGVALMASKKYYFGVGGGTDAFLDLLLHQSQRHATQQRQGKRQKMDIHVGTEEQDQGQEHLSEPISSSSSASHHLPQNTVNVTQSGGDDDSNTLVPSTHAESEQEPKDEQEQQQQGLGQADEWRLIGEVVRTYDDGKSNIRELIRVRWEAVE